MKSWHDFQSEEPALAETGKRLLFPSRPQVGYAFIATIRKDGAPRLHPISVVHSQGHLYVLIPRASPKCSDLLSDGRYALQAFPPVPNVENEEFYLSGLAHPIREAEARQALIDDTQIMAAEDEVLFELLLERVMHTRLAKQGAPSEHPVHKKWRA